MTKTSGRLPVARSTEPLPPPAPEQGEARPGATASPDLSFVPVCIFCGARGEPIPTDAGDGGRWWPAVAFCLIALDSHAKGCPAKRKEPR